MRRRRGPRFISFRLCEKNKQTNKKQKVLTTEKQQKKTKKSK